MSVGHPERTSEVSERPVDVPSAQAAVAAMPTTTESSKGRMRQIDALRVLSCFSVVTVHAIGAPFPPDDVGIGVASFLLHYSREIFFFVSALVLVRTYLPRVGENGRLPDESAFRRRRLRLIGMPYLWWTTLYFAVSIVHNRNVDPWGQVLDDLPLRWLYLMVTGNGSYHMYFLLVTLQFAVVFPLVLRVLRKTKGHHGLVLLGSLLLQAATLSVYQWFYLPDDGWRGILGDASLVAYQFWMVLGAVAGLHMQRWHRMMMTYWRWILAAFPVATAVLLWTFYAQLPTHGSLGASSPLQPIMIMWSLASLGVLYLISVQIMERGSAALRTIFSYGAQLSFGVYLAHPMVLDVVLSLMRRLGLAQTQWWSSLLALVCTVIGAVVVCMALHRTRFSLALMGRPKLDPERAPRLRLRMPRPRMIAGPALLLAMSVVAVLLVGGDQSPPSESGTPTPEEIVEASNPMLPAEDDSTGADAGVDPEPACGDVSVAPHACSVGTDTPPGAVTR
ncbi:acyltransferase [Pseudonocardia spinosispora]|uniref:acyltransferase n=1 Tax=Pseudonocardia spinosispora TaxID=103441 RepID=UPI0003F514F8|nr:acyltransferase [Pseudonocardia spinosispora]